jgi:hypothetical protein
MVEDLLDHLENAVNGWIIETSLEVNNQGLRRAEIFEGLLPHAHISHTRSQSTSNFDTLLRDGPVNSSLVKSLSEARLAQA